MAELSVLQAGPVLTCRTETVDLPELGGAVVVRGLLASELFAVSVYRDQALRRLHEAQAQHSRSVAAAADGQAPGFVAPQMSFEELRAYGLYVSHMLAASVTVANGLSMYTADEWEVCGQQYAGVIDRLQTVVERLSGMNSEDVRKN